MLDTLARPMPHDPTLPDLTLDDLAADLRRLNRQCVGLAVELARLPAGAQDGQRMGGGVVSRSSQGLGAVFDELGIF